MVMARPMSRGEYNEYREWTLPAGEDPRDAGYLVEYLDGGRPNVMGHLGYISWSPADVFDRNYRETVGLTFGAAIEAMKVGQRVARAGWNGKGMWIAISPGRFSLPPERFWATQNQIHAAENGPTDVLPCITMKTATGEVLMGWLASQTDILAEDWEIL